MFVPAPGIVGDRPGVPDCARGLLQLFRGNPARCLNHIRRESSAQRSVSIEYGTAADDAARGGDRVFAFQGKMLAWRVVMPDGRIVADNAIGLRVPRSEYATSCIGSYVL